MEDGGQYAAINGTLPQQMWLADSWVLALPKLSSNQPSLVEVRECIDPLVLNIEDFEQYKFNRVFAAFVMV